MFKKLLIMLTSTILTTTTGLNFILNTNTNTNTTQTNTISKQLRDDGNDEIIRIETSTWVSTRETAHIFTFAFNSKNPNNFKNWNRTYKSNNSLSLHWGNEVFNYKNYLFNSVSNKDSYSNHKMTNWDDVKKYAQLTQKQTEQSFLAYAGLAIYESVTYFYENGQYFFQWAIWLSVHVNSSFSTAFVALSLGSEMTFTK